MRTCAVCGEALVKRKHEAYWQFDERQCCSRTCADVARRGVKTANPEFKARYRQITTPDGRKMLEHRFVMEVALGRRIRPNEQVHHINHDRLDNRVENLEVLSSAEHGMRHTIDPTTKPCVICGSDFTPHKTKRARAQTCGIDCRRALIRLRWAERKAPT